MNEHWSSGLSDMRETLRNRKRQEKPDEDQPFVTHDLHRGRPAGMDAGAAPRDDYDVVQIL